MDFTEDYFRRANEGELGRFGEELWKNVLMQSGIRLIPLCRIEDGGAPMLQGKQKNILPDFTIYGPNVDDHVQWQACIDSKVKTGPVYYEIRKQDRHGIDKWNWLHYKSFANLNRAPAGIAIVELFTNCNITNRWSGSLLLGSFRRLGEPYYGESNQSHMVYWRRNQFKKLGEFSALDLGRMRDGRWCPDFGDHLREEFDHKEQAVLF